MLYFGIPVKSRVVSADWQQVGRLLTNTLRSLLNQTSPQFKILVAHHEVPDTPYRDDPRVEFLPLELPPPLYKQEMMVDKNRKRELVAHRLRREGGGYLMYVDADDLVSNRVAQLVAEGGSPHGYVIERGYELDAASKTVRWAPRFDRLCGSSSIIHFTPADLPETPFAPGAVRLRRYMDLGHAHWSRLAQSEGRPLAPVPFPGAVYVVNTGENHSVATQNLGSRRALLRRFTPSRPVSDALRREFSIP
jgi:hypothetical protein